MFKGKKVLATVCARGGSIGVKRKAVRNLGGHPVIFYSLDIVRRSKLIDEYVISSDSDEIIDTAVSLGFRVDFKRPAELADGSLSRIEPIRHAVKWIEESQSTRFDLIVDLGVATPFKTVHDLDECIRKCVDMNASNVLTVTPSYRNPYYNMVEIQDGRVSKVKDIGLVTSRQKAREVYDMNDAFNVWVHDVLFSDSPQFNAGAVLYVMPRVRSIDIDEEMDLVLAEAVLDKDLFNWEDENS